MNNSFFTPEELSELHTKSKLHRKTVFVITQASKSVFSVARFYGAANIEGERYTYNPKTDELIRDDVLKFVMDLRKKEKPA